MWSLWREQKKWVQQKLTESNATWLQLGSLQSIETDFQVNTLSLNLGRRPVGVADQFGRPTNHLKSNGSFGGPFLMLS